MFKRFNNLPAWVQVACLTALAAGLAAGVFYFGAPGIVESVWGLSEKREGLAKRVMALKAENDRDEAFQLYQTEYLDRIRQMREQIHILGTILPDEPATGRFIRKVYETAMMSGVRIRTLEAKPPITRDFYTEMAFTLQVDGPYYSVLNFFDRLSNQQRIVYVSGLSLGSPAGRGSGNYRIRPNELLGAACVVTTYYLHEPAARPSKR